MWWKKWRSFHILRYEEVILDYTWFGLNFMLIRTACLWPIKHTPRSTLTIKEKNAFTRLFSMPSLQCPCWYSLKDKVPFPDIRVLLTCCVGAKLSLLRLGLNPCHVGLCSLFWEDIKLLFKQFEWSQLAILDVISDTPLYHQVLEFSELNQTQEGHLAVFQTMPVSNWQL